MNILHLGLKFINSKVEGNYGHFTFLCLKIIICIMIINTKMPVDISELYKNNMLHKQLKLGLKLFNSLSQTREALLVYRHI